MSITVMSTFFLMLVYSASLVMGWTCRDFCGPVQVKYPFGTGPGCGDPRFQTYITCHNQRQLIFTSHTGSYPIQQIDYKKHVIHIKDPIMSTCSSMQPSRSFGLDWAAPFRIINDAFVLLGCSPTSCLYDPHNYLCDIGSAHICSSLYACPGIGGLDLPIHAPISSCCVYSPINLGPAVEMNLSRLQCLSYTNIYSFGDDLTITNPSQWRYGVALEYNYNTNNYFPSSCRECEESNGVCGYSGPYETFICVCKNGINTTTNCYGPVYINHDCPDLTSIMIWNNYVWDEAFSKRSVPMILIAGVISMVGILLL